MDYLIDRMREPSTWAGVASMAAGLGFALEPGIWQQVAQAGMAAGGLLAVLMREKLQ